MKNSKFNNTRNALASGSFFFRTHNILHLDIIVQVLPLFYKPLVLPTMWRLASGCHVRANVPKYLCARAKMFSSFPCSSDFVFSSEVRAALEDGRPVVALESTIIAHGMPASASFFVYHCLCFLWKTCPENKHAIADHLILDLAILLFMSARLTVSSKSGDSIKG